jgi:hypothetical protein
MKTSRKIVSLVASVGLAAGMVLAGSASAGATTVTGIDRGCFGTGEGYLTYTSAQAGGCTWTQAGIYRYVSDVPIFYTGPKGANVTSGVHTNGVNAGNYVDIDDSYGSTGWEGIPLIG